MIILFYFHFQITPPSMKDLPQLLNVQYSSSAVFQGLTRYLTPLVNIFWHLRPTGPLKISLSVCIFHH